MSKKAKELGNEPVFPADANPHLNYITKREYFAGLAMQAMIASETESYNYGHFTNLSEFAVKRADALLNELAKDK